MEIDKIFLKFILRCKWTKIVKKMRKKNKDGITLLDIKFYYKVIAFDGFEWGNNLNSCMTVQISL